MVETTMTGGTTPREPEPATGSESQTERPASTTRRATAPKKPATRRAAARQKASARPAPRARTTAKRAAPKEAPAETEGRGLAGQLGGLVTGASDALFGGAKIAGRTASRLGTTIGRSSLGAGRALVSTTERLVGTLRPAAHAEAEANSAAVRRAYRALLKGDVLALEQLIAEDVVWHVPGRSGLAGDHPGREGIVRLFARLSERSGGSLRVDLHDVTASAEHAVALQELRATREGTKLASKQLVVFHIHAGRITEVWGPASMTPYEDDEFWGGES